jgi:hypothetical protein
MVTCSLAIFKLNVSTGLTCSDTALKFITVYKPPVVNAGTLDDTICEGSDPFPLIGYSPVSTLTPGPTPPANPPYGVWNGPGIVSTSTFYNATNPKFTPGPNTSQVNTITYTYTDNNGCTNSDSRVVYVLPKPVGTAGPDRSVCSGVTTIVGGTAQLNLVYKWTSPPAPFFSNTNSAFSELTLVNDFGNTARVTKVALEVIDTLTGCKSRDTVLVTV